LDKLLGNKYLKEVRIMVLYRKERGEYASDSDGRGDDL
jgi:hypothetical protein